MDCFDFNIFVQSQLYCRIFQERWILVFHFKFILTLLNYPFLLNCAMTPIMPKVSIIWLNYNSLHVIEVTKESLNCILNIDYPDFEVILIDNASNDGSDIEIEKFIKNRALLNPIKYIKLTDNLGFTGGMNAGFALRDKSSDYVSLIHNDVLVKTDYLAKLIDYMEQHKDVGAVQGIVVSLKNEAIVDSRGYLMDESLAHVVPASNPMAASITRAEYVTFVEGTMPIYRVCMVEKVLKTHSELFIPCGFMHYLEDVFLSLMLWNKGYSSVLVPIVVASHYRMAVTQKFGAKVSYFAYRNRIALIYMTNSADRTIVFLRHFRLTVIGKASIKERQVMLKALIDGLRLGRLLKKQFGEINIYNGPLCATPLRTRLLI
jgi:GT2 family glycosyltransferase